MFGPVLTFQSFRDEAEGVALANSSDYGLSGIVYTGSAERAERAERVGLQVRASPDDRICRVSLPEVVRVSANG